MKIFIICITCWMSGYLLSKIGDFTSNNIDDDSWER